MQKALVLAGCLGLALPANAKATECRASERLASAVKITIQTPNGPAHGTGIIWDEHGHIVTNDHVATAGTAPMVTFANGETRAARVLAQASDRDLAVLEVDPPPALPSRVPQSDARLPGPAPQAPAEGLRAGDPVFALGNPFGRGLTMASGVVNGFGREVITGPRTHLFNMMETTTPLSPGNSGGPLFDCSGRVVGINTAVLHRNGGSLGFAIPIDRARTVVAELLQGRETVTAVVPVRLGFGLYVIPDDAGGLVVQKVVPGSPAERAGARAGDAIMGANGSLVSSPAELQRLIQQTGIGTVAVLRVLRYGAPMDMPMRITPVVFASSH